MPEPDDVEGCESFAAGFVAGAEMDPASIDNADRWAFASPFAYLCGRLDLISKATTKVSKVPLFSGGMAEALRRRPARSRRPPSCTFLDTYACCGEDRHMSSGLKRRSYFVDEHAIRRAKKILGVATDAEVVRLAVERIAEMERFWKLMEDTRGKLAPGSLERP